MIAVSSDHGGYALKSEIKGFLEEYGYSYKDLGTFNADESVDYPDYGHAVALAVKSGEFNRGIIICGTGIGISIAANKVPGIRAALCTDSYMARMSREHNNANILALGGRVTGPGTAVEIVRTWLNTDFSGDRHSRRVNKITNIEREYLSNGGNSN